MEVPYRLFGQTGASQDFAMKEILFIEKKSHISIQMSCWYKWFCDIIKYVNFCKAIEVLANGRIFSKVLTQNIKMVLGAACNLSAEEIDERLLELQNEMLELTELHAKAGADSTKYDQEYERLANEIQQLRFQKQNLQGHNSERLLKRTVTTEMLEFLENQSFLILKYDDSLVRKYVENVRVFEDKVIVEFKSGVETEVAR